MKEGLWLPPGYRYRELWLPQNIIPNSSLLRSVHSGQSLALTGARLGTTCDGFCVPNTANGYVSCGAIHNAATEFWLSFWFKPDRLLGAAAGIGIWNMWGKHVGPDDYTKLHLDVRGVGDGKLYFTNRTGGVTHFAIASAEAIWYAGQWYHVIASISSTAGARLIIDGGAAVVDADVNPIVNGGTFVIGTNTVPGVVDGKFRGEFRDFFVGTDDLTAPEEAELYKGIPPADAVNVWLFDEGRGVTCTDRGTGGNNATLAAGAQWQWGQVKQAVLSLDGINDHAESSAGVDIMDALSLIVVIKAKSTYDGLGADHYFVHAYGDAGNELRIYYDNAADVIRFHAEGVNTSRTVDYSTKPVIDDYLILILTLSGDTLKGFVNGTLVGSASGVKLIVFTPATIVYIGAEQTPGDYDISKPLLAGLIEGALSENEAKQTSRFVNNMLGLGLTI